MSCEGCSGAVSRILSKTEGVSKFDISLPEQTVVVTSSLPQQAVFEAIQKSGKATKIKA
ncbi:hypothetical protein BC831DRAFT_451954 [Entophlyctis helioformis]|nr:hypothetical protein BC831DRAFT_451954 [Entophlyctis helioformis]